MTWLRDHLLFLAVLCVVVPVAALAGYVVGTWL